MKIIDLRKQNLSGSFKKDKNGNVVPNIDNDATRKRYNLKKDEKKEVKEVKEAKTPQKEISKDKMKEVGK